MRMLILSCLAAFVLVTSLVESADAGRRRRRRVAVAAGVVAATSRRPTVVAVAPVRRVVPAPVVVPSHSSVFSPDLTLTEMGAEGELQCITVKNIGQVASPRTVLQLDFHRGSDQLLVATKRLQVLPLQVNQSIRFRLRALPQGSVQVNAEVDPDHRVAETNELNNDMTLKIASPPPVLEPAPLEDVDVWIEPDVTEAARGATNHDHQE